jgi:hypothetical protein
MFKKLPKGHVAQEKVKALSEFECALLDMHMTAAFGRPDSHVQVIDYIRSKQHGVWFDIFVIEIDMHFPLLAKSEL